MKVDGNTLFTGNVRIGTQTPTAPFTNYKLAVDGSIIAKEVHVNLTTWADNVFDEKYDLLSLQEIEKFIKENKHLPEVPSEKQAIENGIDLGQMNALLLKKIEELTLHLIEMQKQINKQNQEITKLISK